MYDNYNALPIGFASTERTSDVIVSLAVYARGVNFPLPRSRRGYTVVKSVSAKQRPRRARLAR